MAPGMADMLRPLTADRLIVAHGGAGDEGLRVDAHVLERVGLRVSQRLEQVGQRREGET